MLLSIVTCGKNDNFAGNFKERLTNSLSKNLDNIKRLGVKDVEILVTDWGSEEKLVDVIDIEDNEIIKFIHVPYDLAKKYSPDTEFSLPHAINTAIQRSRGEYIFYIDGDVYLPYETFSCTYDLVKKNKEDYLYYWTSRIHLPYKFHERVNRKGIDDRIDEWNRLGKKTVEKEKLAEGFYHEKINLNNFSWSETREENNFQGGAAGILLSRNIVEESSFFYEGYTRWGFMDIEFAERLREKYPCQGDLEDKLQCHYFHLGHHEIEIGFVAAGWNHYNKPENFHANDDNWGLKNENLVVECKRKGRRYLPTLAELIDRLSISQLKEVFITEHKDEYGEEIRDILHDIDLLLSGAKLDAKTIRAIVVLAQMNLHIWHNESNYRKGIKEGNSLELTHGLNGIRNTAKNMIQEVVGGRKDYKLDCLAAEFKDWEISWN